MLFMRRKVPPRNPDVESNVSFCIAKMRDQTSATILMAVHCLVTVALTMPLSIFVESRTSFPMLMVI